jgi:hypothetical protein
VQDALGSSEKGHWGYSLGSCDSGEIRFLQCQVGARLWICVLFFDFFFLLAPLGYCDGQKECYQDLILSWTRKM